MPSPFPGMDPFLEDEKTWPAFHHQMIASLYQALLPGLVERYRARIGMRTFTTEEPLFTSMIRQDHTEEVIELRHRTDGRLITLIDLPSPINKKLAQGRAAYLETRKGARNQGAGVVEIDLCLQGQPLLDYNREGLPEWDYAVTVTRSTQPDRFEIYTSTLAKRLPRFKVPLAADDRDTVLDLQVCFARAFENGGFGPSIDYAKDPPHKSDESKLKTIDDWLKQASVRNA
jgi:hypothetical protein